MSNTVDIRYLSDSHIIYVDVRFQSDGPGNGLYEVPTNVAEKLIRDFPERFEYVGANDELDGVPEAVLGAELIEEETETPEELPVEDEDPPVEETPEQEKDPEDVIEEEGRGRENAPGQAEDKVRGKSAEAPGRTGEKKPKPERGVGRGGKGKGAEKGKGLNKKDEGDSSE